jgi:hypothetical protein
MKYKELCLEIRKIQLRLSRSLHWKTRKDLKKYYYRMLKDKKDYERFMGMTNGI